MKINTQTMIMLFILYDDFNFEPYENLALDQPAESKFTAMN